jgi:hypothetical protein
MDVEFSGEIFHWRGPAPYYFVRVPEEESEDIRDVSTGLTYGWGVIPVTVQVGDTEFTTALIPKDGRYLVPLKDKVRKAEDLGDGDTISLRLSLGAPG